MEEAKEICDEQGVKLVALAQPLRLALTGKTRSPGIFELLSILSLEEGRKRIKNLISQL
jgi:glutamyl-tRNA synthetase